MLLKLASKEERRVTGSRFLLFYDCNRNSVSEEFPETNNLSQGGSRANQLDCQ